MTGRLIGIYGGSFDPPHLGHVLSVAWVLSATDVEEVWVIPTWEHPFAKAHRASFDRRMAMCELAFALFRSVRTLDVERQLAGVSRTLRTLETLRTEHPDARFRLLIGADVLPTTDRWHRWDEIVRIAPALVVGRDGYPLPEGCPISIPDVSSTDIRTAFDDDEDPTGLLPASVLDYIQAHGLYSGDE